MILKMSWLLTCRGKIDCRHLKFILGDEKGCEVCFCRQREEKPGPLISIMKATKLLCQGCIRYWCCAIDFQRKEETIEDISVVCEFRDVFPKKLLRFPP